MLHINWNLIGSKFVSGIETYLLGLAALIGPQVLTYTSSFDFTKFGLSANTASAIGAIIVALRAFDSIGEITKPVQAASGLTGAEIAGPNAANK